MGLCLMLFDENGNAVESVMWKDAIRRLVDAQNGTGSALHEFAVAHKALETIFGWGTGQQPRPNEVS